MVTTSFLACAAPRLVAPAMNDRMYRDAATQANLATLRERGVIVIEPEEGALASRGEQGLGRLPEPRSLLDAVEAVLPRPAGAWDGLRVLVSAGGTREAIDPVRFIGNRSSGRMGLALAARAAARGADVTLIAANVSLPGPPGVARVDVETADELKLALEREFEDSHVLLMAAAPADFRPSDPAAEKIAREGAGLSLELEPTEDILAALGRRRRNGPDDRRLRRRDRRGPRAGSREARAQGRRRDRPQRRLPFRDRLRERRQRGRDRRARCRDPRPARLQGRGRGRDPRPRRGYPRPERLPRPGPIVAVVQPAC